MIIITGAAGFIGSCITKKLVIRLHRNNNDAIYEDNKRAY